ncbi:MAG: nitroreductase family protein [Atopobiaceae bacterium]|nr:nitroreductase family protein [Atopobiaceae bacterium]
MNSFLELAHDRFSCRKYSDQPVEPEMIDAIIEAGIVAPTAVNYQPVRIWRFDTPEALTKVRACTEKHYDAPVILAVGGLPDEAWVRPSDGKNYAIVDASIVGTHMMLAAHDLGLRSVWVGWFDSPALKSAFPEMEPYEMVALFPIGYAAEDAKPSPRHTQYKPYEELVHRL